MKKTFTYSTKQIATTIYDYVIFGTGYIGFSAALRLAKANYQVLLVESSGQLLWESTAALENQLSKQSKHPAWFDWIDDLRAFKACNEYYFDPVGAEILAAERLSSKAACPNIDTVLYAPTVSVEVLSQQIISVTLATKSGLQQIQARHWLDCTENAEIYKLTEPEADYTCRRQTQIWRIGLQSNQWQIVIDQLQKRNTATPITLIGSLKKEEQYLSWISHQGAWGQPLVEQLRTLRKELPKEASVIVSHCGMMPYPKYEISKTPSPLSIKCNNLTVLSPSVNAEIAPNSIEERFLVGATSHIPRPLHSELTGNTAKTVIAINKVISCDVLVAGTGTAGSIAAMASAQKGAKTIAIDSATHPGGIGAGGGITGYFYGISGGFQTQVDKLTNEITELLLGHAPSKDSWHHDAKKLAILQIFEQQQITFNGHLLLFDVEKKNGQVTAVYAASAGQVVKYEASSFIDSTGDGDLCTRAGAAYTIGRSGDGRNLAYSLAALALERKGAQLGLQTFNYDAGWLDPTSALDLTRARLTGIGLYKNSNAYKNGTLIAIAPILGIRQSRQIVTDYILQLDDLVSQRKFSDSIGEAGCHADSHSVDFEFEDDEMVFFYWACRLFRAPLRTQLPYRMLIPRGLTNVWIACRAAGMSPNAFYAIRMQRDMQRLGEIAGKAAAQLAAQNNHVSARDIKLSTLLRDQTETFDPTDPYGTQTASDPTPLKTLENGQSGLSLWQIYQSPKTYSSQIKSTLNSDNLNATFYTACVLAMWNDPTAETRLLTAIHNKEIGAINPQDNAGAYGQEIDIPFWLLAIILLRRCGTNTCNQTLVIESANHEHLLNVRTSIALTVERLIQKASIAFADALAITENLMASIPPDSNQLPSRSIARSMRNEKQITLPNNSGAEKKEDHLWQLHLVICRIQSACGQQPTLAKSYQDDERVHVRDHFHNLQIKARERTHQVNPPSHQAN
ncbi:FAD-dependent oxidoreductase [Coraliomargarita sp. SDUM461004]|uniref:FAD-dependent oxidoreductase n=1 Tax=Thalassobacterium sedimentorum TaxID=3041258 RepID=A0ABU1AGT0_9BACT|nr:FAD-dependent oxidoreductase [Coraliomargarita sp. SDUM461004]MDQ8192981.1 FAD-dependent oxidoreductase [Coraliomargarita sp. SDUM461004]